MGDLPGRHLDIVAMRMGAFLRGFSDPRVHLGSAARFAAEFKKVMEYPALHPRGEVRTISYLEAAESCPAPGVEKSDGQAIDPVATMVWGLSNSPIRTGVARNELPLNTLREDLSALLRAPLMRFCIQVSDRDVFQRESQP